MRTRGPGAATMLRRALRGLAAHPLRALLTTVGIVMGVAALTATIAIGNGAKALIGSEIRSLGSNILLVQPGSARDGAVRLGAGSAASLTHADADAISAEIPGVVVAAPAVAAEAQVVRAGRNWSTLVGGVPPGYLIARDWTLADGRPFTAQEAQRAAKVALIGQTLAERLFPDASPLGARIRIGDVPVQVIGVLAAKGQSAAGHDQDDVALIPLKTAKIRVFGDGGADRRAVDLILVKLAAAEAIAPAAERIRLLLRQRHRIAAGAPDDARVIDPIAAMEAETAILDDLRLLLSALASVSLVVAGITIANIMLVAVAERTRDIGIALAVGARPGDVMAELLLEAALLALLGGLAGVALGFAITSVVALALGWAVPLGFGAVALGLGLAALVGLGAGIVPALTAARTDLVAALRSE